MIRVAAETLQAKTDDFVDYHEAAATGRSSRSLNPVIDRAHHSKEIGAFAFWSTHSQSNSRPTVHEHGMKNGLTMTTVDPGQPRWHSRKGCVEVVDPDVIPR
jgi:hypothetical protein